MPNSQQGSQAVLMRRLDALRALKQETERTYSQLEAEAERTLREYEHQADQIDAAWAIFSVAKVATMIVKKGALNMALSGAKLEEANMELAKDAGKMALDPMKGAAIKEGSRLKNSSSFLAFCAGQTLQATDDALSPTFWFRVVTNLNEEREKSGAVSMLRSLPESIRQADAPGEAMLQNIRRQRSSTIRNLDRQIEDTQRALRGF